MKSIAYAIVSAVGFVLGCFAPDYVDRMVMTGVGMFCLAALVAQPAQKP